MDLRQIKIAAMLLKDYIDNYDNNIGDNGTLAFKVYLKDGSQKSFEDIQTVIDWVQVQKLRVPLK